MKHARQFLALVNAAREGVHEVDIHTVKQWLDEGRPFRLVDVREESEWREGHLPSALHLSKGILERDAEAKLPDFGQEIVLYCGGGFRSVLAAENLQKMGYSRVHSMDGGWRAWNAAYYPIVK